MPIGCRIYCQNMIMVSKIHLPFPTCPNRPKTPLFFTHWLHLAVKNNVGMLTGNEILFKLGK